MDHNSLTFMQEPNKWPNWPILPVRKPVAMHSPILGVMVDTDQGVKPIVYLANVWDMSGSTLTIDQYEKEEFVDFEGVYDAGWRVD